MEKTTNNLKFNNTEISDTESNLILSGRETIQSYEVTVYAAMVRENIALDLLIHNNPLDKEMLEGIYELILETILHKGAWIVIASDTYPAEFVKSKFLKFNDSHVLYVLNCMKGNTTKVYNIKKYLLAALFNAPTTISGYYQSEVNHDMSEFAVRKVAQ